MQNATLRKIKSSRGASLSIALFLFLICSVLGAVLLTAATTASGRLADLAEMDQRYYAVTSAAELLAKELTKDPVKITQTKTVNRRVETIGPDDDPKTVIRYAVTYKTNVNGNTESVILSANDTEPVSTDGTRPDGEMSFLTARAFELMFGDKKCNTEAALDYSFKNSVFAGQDSPKSFDMAFSSADGNLAVEHLAVDVSYQMMRSGALILTVTNKTGEPYTLKMTLTPKFTENKTSRGAWEESITTNEATVQWELDSIQSEVAKAE